MPIKDYLTTATSNTTISSINIGEGCNPANINNAIRQLMADIAREDVASATIPSAATVDLGAQTGSVTITGTTAIASFGTAAAGLVRRVWFTGALTLTHNATSLILKGGANITTANGDSALFESLGAGNWRMLDYARADGTALAVLNNYENPIINPDFTYWQRGTSLTFGAGGGYQYLADRWVCYSNLAATFARSTDAPSGFQYSMDITSGNILQSIESNIAKFFAGKTITVTFCAKRVSGSGNLEVYLSHPTTNTDDWSVLTNFGYSAIPFSATSFTEYKATFSNVSANVVRGMRLWLGSPTTPNQYRIAWVKIEVGQGTAGFQPRHPALELTLCQRYYEIARGGAVSYASSATAVQRFPVIYKVTKRTLPTVSLAVASGAGTSPVVAGGGSENGFLCGFAAASAGLEITVDARADAEL